ncbi:MAG: hypothetical protein K5694_07405, partial [Bacilli bacterium]|nr:hypothetical protein [Bacilli bacterium]
PNGDDAIWHKSYVFDLVYGWRNGFFGLNGGHNFLGTSGYNIYLFYSPLPHVFIGLFCLVFNMPVVIAMKVGSIIISIVGVLFTYYLGKKITGNRSLAFAAGVAFAFFPYRIYDFIGRDAICEGFAICFIPILFYGVYAILNDEKFKVSSYIAAIIGSAGLVLSHPYTALLAGIAAALLIAFSPTKLWRVLKMKESWVALPVSILLIVGLVAFYVFPMLQATGTGYYNISNDVRMLTTREYLMSTLDGRFTKSGFLNFDWLITQKKNYGETVGSWTFEIFMFPFLGSVAIFLLNYFFKKDKKQIAILSSLGVLLLPLIFIHREEYVLASIFFAVSLLLVHFHEKEKSDLNESVALVKKLPMQTELYGLFLMLIFEMLLVWTAFIWQVVPKVFLMSQFTFRSWAIFIPLLIIIIGILVKPFAKNRYVQEGVLLLSFFSLVVCMPMVSKRFAFYNWSGYSDEPSLQYVRSLDRVGWQSEYAPRCFYESYTPTYANGLYAAVRNEIRYNHDFRYTVDTYRTPAFLEGMGTMQIETLNIPNATFTLTVNSVDAFVQLPQFYYDGYHLTLENESGKEVINGEYADGLVAFHVKYGVFAAKLTYDRPTSANVARPFFYISVSLLPILGAFGYFYNKKKEKSASKIETEEIK